MKARLFVETKFFSCHKHLIQEPSKVHSRRIFGSVNGQVHLYLYGVVKTSKEDQAQFFPPSFWCFNVSSIVMHQSQDQVVCVPTKNRITCLISFKDSTKPSKLLNSSSLCCAWTFFGTLLLGPWKVNSMDIEIHIYCHHWERPFLFFCIEAFALVTNEKF